MAISFDSASGFASGTSTSISQSHTVGSGSDKILFAMIGISSNNVDPTVTYGGVAMTKVTSVQVDSAFYIYCYVLVNPATGTANIQSSFGSSVFMRVGGASYFGVTQSTTVDSFATNRSASATSWSIPTTVVASSCWLFGSVITGSAISTNDYTTRATNFDTRMVDSNGTVSTGVNTFTGTYSPSSLYGGFLVSFSPAVSNLANLKTLDGIAKANIKTINGIAIANVKTYNGIA